jgi:hypothetical protein
METITETTPDPIEEIVPTTDKVCDCVYCATGRIIHWYCDSQDCETPGPYRFSHADPAGTPMRTPYGQRQFNNTKGLVAGIRRWCSAKCAIAEERVYLLDLIDKAQARGDTNTIRVINGRLHEMAQQYPPQIPTRNEKLTRVEERASSLTSPDTEADGPLSTT